MKKGHNYLFYLDKLIGYTVYAAPLLWIAHQMKFIAFQKSIPLNIFFFNTLLDKKYLKFR